MAVVDILYTGTEIGQKRSHHTYNEIKALSISHGRLWIHGVKESRHPVRSATFKISDML